MRTNVVASTKLDVYGKAVFSNARTGTYTYWLTFLVDVPYNGSHLVWNLRVDLKPGANSVSLDQRNTTPIDR